MRFDRDHLTFKALAALDEAVEECRRQPVRQTMALRFALAFLYAVGTGERAVFDEFWQVIQKPSETGSGARMARYVLSTSAQTALNGIARSVGVELNVDACEVLTDMRSPKAARNERVAHREMIAAAKAKGWKRN